MSNEPVQLVPSAADHAGLHRLRGGRGALGVTGALAQRRQVAVSRGGAHRPQGLARVGQDPKLAGVTITVFVRNNLRFARHPLLAVTVAVTTVIRVG